MIFLANLKHWIRNDVKLFFRQLHTLLTSTIRGMLYLSGASLSCCLRNCWTSNREIFSKNKRLKFKNLLASLRFVVIAFSIVTKWENKLLLIILLFGRFSCMFWKEKKMDQIHIANVALWKNSNVTILILNQGYIKC